MLNNDILKTTFRFPAKRATKNMFVWTTLEGLEFQTNSKYVFFQPHNDLKQKNIAYQLKPFNDQLLGCIWEVSEVWPPGAHPKILKGGSIFQKNNQYPIAVNSNLKLLSKLYVSRSNRSRVISKSL